jgi:predicted RNase H-like HicB family nuclease
METVRVIYRRESDGWWAESPDIEGWSAAGDTYAEVYNLAVEAKDGWLRGADRIAAYIDAPRSRVYALASARRIPVHRDGSALIARRSELDRWLLQGGGLRT